MANFHQRERGSPYTLAPLRHPKARRIAGYKTKPAGEVLGEQWATAGAVGRKRQTHTKSILKLCV